MFTENLSTVSYLVLLCVVLTFSDALLVRHLLEHIPVKPPMEQPFFFFSIVLEDPQQVVRI